MNRELVFSCAMLLLAGTTHASEILDSSEIIKQSKTKVLPGRVIKQQSTLMLNGINEIKLTHTKVSQATANGLKQVFLKGGLKKELACRDHSKGVAIDIDIMSSPFVFLDAPKALLATWTPFNRINKPLTQTCLKGRLTQPVKDFVAYSDQNNRELIYYYIKEVQATKESIADYCMNVDPRSRNNAAKAACLKANANRKDKFRVSGFSCHGTTLFESRIEHLEEDTSISGWKIIDGLLEMKYNSLKETWLIFASPATGFDQIGIIPLDEFKAGKFDHSVSVVYQGC